MDDPYLDTPNYHHPYTALCGLGDTPIKYKHTPMPFRKKINYLIGIDLLVALPVFLVKLISVMRPTQDSAFLAAVFFLAYIFLGIPMICVLVETLKIDRELTRDYPQ